MFYDYTQKTECFSFNILGIMILLVAVFGGITLQTGNLASTCR